MICIWLLFSRIDDSGRNWTRVRFPVAIALKAAIAAASIEWPQQLLAILLVLAIYGPCMWELTTLVGPTLYIYQVIAAPPQGYDWVSLIDDFFTGFC